MLLKTNECALSVACASQKRTARRNRNKSLLSDFQLLSTVQDADAPRRPGMTFALDIHARVALSLIVAHMRSHTQGDLR
jgi:hypothetical protein